MTAPTGGAAAEAAREPARVFQEAVQASRLPPVPGLPVVELLLPPGCRVQLQGQAKLRPLWWGPLRRAPSAGRTSSVRKKDSICSGGRPSSLPGHTAVKARFTRHTAAKKKKGLQAGVPREECTGHGGPAPASGPRASQPGAGAEVHRITGQMPRGSPPSAGYPATLAGRSRAPQGCRQPSSGAGALGLTTSSELEPTWPQTPASLPGPNAHLNSQPSPRLHAAGSPPHAWPGTGSALPTTPLSTHHSAFSWHQLWCPALP